MIQPKYSPEEALQRVKLMMGYDLKKSLRENKEIIFEQSNDEITKNIAYSIDAAAWRHTFGAPGEILDAVKKIKTPIQFYNINAYLKSEKSKIKRSFGQIIPYCFTSNNDLNNKQLEEIKTHLESLGFKIDAKPITFNSKKGEIYPAVFKITGAPQPNNSKTISVTEISQRQQNINNIYCSVDLSTNIIKNKYSNYYNNKPLDEFIKNQKVTPEEIEIAKKSCTKPVKSNASKEVYTFCDGVYKRKCKSSLIKKAQACLGMPEKYQTGNFGPITQGELKKKFPQFETQFTTDDVYSTICKGTSPATVPNIKQLNPNAGDEAINNQFINDNK